MKIKVPGLGNRISNDSEEIRRYEQRIAELKASIEADSRKIETIIDALKSAATGDRDSCSQPYVRVVGRGKRN